MAKRIFITATNTDVGKTYTTIKLLHFYAEMGLKVGVIKPLETGVQAAPIDGTLLFKTICELNPAMAVLSINDIVPLQFELPAAPYIANHAKPIDFNAIDAALEKVEALCDVLLIEGAGGLLVPLDKTHMIIDLIPYFKAKTLLVSHGDLGCINDTLQNIQTLKNAKIDFQWAINCKNYKSFEKVSKPYFDDTFSSYFIINSNFRDLAKTLL